MDPRREQHIFEIFRTALDCDPARRHAVLDELCARGPGVARTKSHGYWSARRRTVRTVSRQRQYRRPRARKMARPSPVACAPGRAHPLSSLPATPSSSSVSPPARSSAPPAARRFRLERESTASWSPAGHQRRLGQFELIETDRSRRLRHRPQGPRRRDSIASSPSRFLVPATSAPARKTSNRFLREARCRRPASFSVDCRDP